MATRSLGQLTLDLIARIGGFTGPMDQAARNAEKNAKRMRQSAKGAAVAWGELTKIAAGVAAGFSALSVMRSVIDNTRALEQEQAQLAAVLVSTGEAAGFNRAQLNAMAASLAGVSIYSTNEINQAQTTLLAFSGVVGNEFTRAMQASMDMATRTGMSVSAAAEMVGRALDVPSQGLTSLSRQGFRFTAEQKRLAEHLEATGRTAEAQAIVLEALEESYAGASRAARDTYGGALSALRNTIDGLLTGDEASMEAARDAVERLNDVLSSEETQVAFADFIAGVADVATEVATATAKLAEFVHWVHAAGVGAKAAFELAGKSAGAVAAITETATQGTHWWEYLSLQTAPAAISRGLISNWNQTREVMEAAGEDLAETSEKYATRIDEILERPVDGSAVEQHTQVLDGLLGNLTTSAGLAADAITQVDEQALRAAQRLHEALQKQVDQLSLQARTLGMAADEERLYRLAVEGATEAQLAQASAALEQISAFEQQRKVQEDYRRLVAELLTDEEKLTEQARARLAVLDAIRDISADEREQQAGRIAAAVVTDAPQFGGLAPEIGGPMGELDKLDEAEQELARWYATQLNMLEQFRAERADMTEQWDAQEQAVKAQHEARLDEIEQARQRARMAAGEAFFGGLAGLSKAFFGEQSSLYKAMFAIEKGYAMAKAMINVPKAYSEAYAAVVGIPVVGPVLAPVAGTAAAAAQLAQAASIGSINLSGMAHDGLDEIPREGTWLLDRGERVVDARTNADLKDFLASREAIDKPTGAPVVQVTVHVDSDGNTSTDTMAPQEYERMGQHLGQLVDEAVRRSIQMEQRQGGLLDRNRERR
ncbi:phage tail length tape measure family protein [Pseudomonas tohonis]|uniref:phage tail length tape measure family protein n=1 Tax=Pseudomonas sp. zfem005 TaxID=3078200 RepID=UPI00039842E3|nr:phage tail length tape measure family protein [Pseudomonas sp. zfem005]EQM72069.1 hypothetical protein L682_00210 [Pseudomonas alcaligenes OT 69]MDN4145967.1 phage tail length tape measure family protein [Pseudomonas tohonis]MDU9415300.1 phage tail length tape measure family protein [Pseudomonas sp. zfem005]